MEEIDIATVTKRSIRGIFSLVSRTLVIQIIGFIVGNLLLPAFLAPSVYGVFYVVSAFIGFLTYFSDIGLAAALVQKKEEITQEDLRTTFSIQQLLVGALVVLSLIFAEPISSFYHYGKDGTFLFQALIIAFFLSSLKTIPSVMLERKLLFNKLVIPQILETLVFNIVALVLAMNSFGIQSFAYAVLARGMIGLIAIYVISPWRVSFGFSRSVAKSLLAFGLPFQVNSFLALLKDDLLIVYLGKVLPFSQIGYIGFAQKWAFVSLRLIMDNIIRITFPSFSRLQHDERALSIALEKSLFASAFFVFPSVIGLIIVFPYFIHFIPQYHKWEPALLAMTFFGVNALCSSVSTPLTNVLNAIGKIRTSLNLMIFWTVATWVLTPLFITWYGFNGVAMVSALVACSVIGVVMIVRRSIQLNMARSIGFPAFASILMGGILYFVTPLIAISMPMLIVVVALGAILYCGFLYLMAREQIRADILFVITNLKK